MDNVKISADIARKYKNKKTVFSSWKECRTDANGVHFFKCQNCNGEMPLYGSSMGTYCTHCGAINNP